MEPAVRIVHCVGNCTLAGLQYDQIWKEVQSGNPLRKFTMGRITLKITGATVGEVARKAIFHCLWMSIRKQLWYSISITSHMTQPHIDLATSTNDLAHSSDWQAQKSSVADKSLPRGLGHDAKFVARTPRVRSVFCS